jgi:hypothetical protein
MSQVRKIHTNLPGYFKNLDKTLLLEYVLIFRSLKVAWYKTEAMYEESTSVGT